MSVHDHDSYYELWHGSCETLGALVGCASNLMTIWYIHVVCVFVDNKVSVNVIAFQTKMVDVVSYNVIDTNNFTNNYHVLFRRLCTGTCSFAPTSRHWCYTPLLCTLNFLFHVHRCKYWMLLSTTKYHISSE